MTETEVNVKDGKQRAGDSAPVMGSAIFPFRFTDQRVGETKEEMDMEMGGYHGSA